MSAAADDLVEIFQKAWHAADERGEAGGRTRAGIEAVLAFQSLQTVEDPVRQQLESLVEGAEAFKSEHGSCRVTVGPNAPIAKAQIQQVAGFWVDVEVLTLISAGGDDDLVIDGSLLYFRANETEGDEVTAKDIVCAVDWLGLMDDIGFSSADWSSVEDSGLVHLEGHKGDLLVDATFVLREFSVRRDWDLDLGHDGGEEGNDD